MAQMILSGEEEEVYEPAEDTYLLLKAALAEAKASDSVLEVGCGKGWISRHLAPKVRRVLATDINPYAVRIVREYGIPVVRADLFEGINGKFDMIIFNPPYLPTSDEEKTAGWLNFALDGGKSGRETINRFLEDLGPHLSLGGRAFLLLSSLTGMEEVEEKAHSLGFEVCEVVAERFFFEELYVLKLYSVRQ